MDTSIIRLTGAASDQPGYSIASARTILVWLAQTLLLVIPAVLQDKARTLLDFTTPEQPAQQGLGVPGDSGGGTSAGPLRPATYKLSLRANILRASVSPGGDLLLEVQLKNAGPAVFDLPVSRNISAIQRTPGRLRREFIFAVRPVGKGREGWTVAVTAASTAVPHSTFQLKPGESAQVLLRVQSDRLRRAMSSEAKELRLEVVCGEWALDDTKFLIRSKALELTSENTALFEFHDDTPSAVTSQR